LKAFPLYLGTERSGWTYRLKDESTWRQFGYHLFALVVGGAGAVLVAAVWAVGAVLTMAPLVGLSPFWIAAGIVLLFAAPWPARLVAAADLLTARALLGPSGKAVLSERVASVERSRVELIDAADDARRRIERDLHDGMQQRLVALAMNLGMAKLSYRRGTRRPAGTRATASPGARMSGSRPAPTGPRPRRRSVPSSPARVPRSSRPPSSSPPRPPSPGASSPYGSARSPESWCCSASSRS
jgi:hypothetical protein